GSLLSPAVAGTRSWQSMTPGALPASITTTPSLGITEITSIALGSVGVGAAHTSVVISGAQDNGTSHQLQPLAPVWDQIGGGDGAIVQVSINGDVPTYYWTSQNFGNFRSWTDTDSDGLFEATDSIVLLHVNVGASSLAQADSGSPGGKMPFITQYVLNSQAPNQILIGGRGLWVINNVTL